MSWLKKHQWGGELGILMELGRVLSFCVVRVFRGSRDVVRGALVEVYFGGQDYFECSLDEERQLLMTLR